MKSIPVQKFLFAIILILGVNSLAMAQENLKVVNRASINPVNNFDTTFQWMCVFNLIDTTNVSKIHVKMGTAYQQSNILNYDFAFDNDAYLPGSYTYRRDSHQITLGLGNYQFNNYFLEIQIEDTVQTLLTPVYWNN